MVQKALKKYSKFILQQNIKNIYIVKSLSFSNVSAAGTNSKFNIYISNNGIDNGYTNEFIELTFH